VPYRPHHIAATIRPRIASSMARTAKTMLAAVNAFGTA